VDGVEDGAAVVSDIIFITVMVDVVASVLHGALKPRIGDVVVETNQRREKKSG
jgi:hypothetical protein